MRIVVRWLYVGAILLTSWAQASDSSPVPSRRVGGDLDERAHLQTVHSEMDRECGAAPGGPKCRRLRREFQQEARNYRRRHNK